MLYLANNRLLLINNGNSLYRIDSQTQPESDIPFIFTIDTTSGTGNSFNLPLRSGYEYNFVVDWGDEQTSEITSWDDAEKLHTYSTDGVYTISITGLCEAWYFNDAGDRLKLTSIDQWGNTGFVNMGSAFHGCSNLTTANDTDGTWCSSVTDMGNMFSSCSSLTTLDVSNWNVSNVRNMGGMFYDCPSLTTLNVSNWDVSNVISMQQMLNGCSLLETLNVSNWNVSNVTSMSYMFYGCSLLATLNVSNWNVSNVINMSGMFSYCELLATLNVSTWNVSNVTTMSDMFYNTPLDTTSYDALLIGWSGLPSLKSNVRFHANLSQYSCDAEEAHNTLTSSPNNWTIYDADLNVDNCDGEPVGGDDFKFTIDTNLGTGASMTLPLRVGYTYNFVVDWGDGQTSEITSFDDVDKTHTYATGGEYQIKITGTCEAWYFNNGRDRLKLTSIDQWGRTGFKDMGFAFRGCSNLTGSTDSDGGWCSGVGNMGSMFIACSSLTTLDVSNWDTSSVTGMDWMFANCSSLTPLDVSNWDISSVANMSRMFSGCSSLTTLDVSNWNTSSVTRMDNMFIGCSSLTTLDVSNWNTSSVIYMSYMFSGCSSLTTLNISNWDITSIERYTTINSMYQMFTGCPLSTESYDAALISWSQQNVKTGVRLDANLTKYSAGAAATARGKLTSAPNNWTIIDAGQVI